MSMQPKIVLVIDDDEKARWISERIIKKAGFDVFTAVDGEDGLQKVHDLRPDLIILDVMMPKLDGYEVFRCLKANHTTADIKVVMLTAKGDTVDIWIDGKAVVGGFTVDMFLSKPVMVQELVACVKELLGANGLK